MIYVVAPTAFLLGAIGQMALSNNMILAYCLVVAAHSVLHIMAINKYSK